MTGLAHSPRKSAVVFTNMAPSWSNTPSGTMTAAVLTHPAAQPPSKAFSIITAYPKPTLPSPDWVLVHVHAAGLNRAELRSRDNLTPARAEFNIFRREYHEDPPAILGEEFVGFVAEAGSSTDFQQGELVTGFIYGGGKAHDGAYAQYTICHKRRLYRLPADAASKLPMEVLGAIPMSMWTAFGSLFQAAGLTKGQTLLVHGATSSVGLWAVLLAKDCGCTVVATTRQEGKVAKLKASGADYVVLEDELEAEIPKLYPKGVDVVLELVGPDRVVPFALPKLARHGTVVCPGVLSNVWSVGPDFTPAMIPPTRKLTFYSTTNATALGEEDEELDAVEPVLADVIGKIEKGTFKPDHFLDKVFDLQDVGKAHDYMEENRAVGKVVVRIE